MSDHDEYDNQYDNVDFFTDQSLVPDPYPYFDLASPRYQVHPELESGLFDPDSVDLAGHWGVGAPADRSVLGRRAVAQR